MPVILLWGIPTLFIVVGGGWWLMHMHHLPAKRPDPLPRIGPFSRSGEPRLRRCIASPWP